MREKKNVVVKFRDNQKMRKKAVLWLNLIYCEYFFLSAIIVYYIMYTIKTDYLYLYLYVVRFAYKYIFLFFTSI